MKKLQNLEELRRQKAELRYKIDLQEDYITEISAQLFSLKTVKKAAMESIAVNLPSSKNSSGIGDVLKSTLLTLAGKFLLQKFKR